MFIGSTPRSRGDQPHPGHVHLNERNFDLKQNKLPKKLNNAGLIEDKVLNGVSVRKKSVRLVNFPERAKPLLKDIT